MTRRELFEKVVDDMTRAKLDLLRLRGEDTPEEISRIEQTGESLRREWRAADHQR